METKTKRFGGTFTFKQDDDGDSPEGSVEAVFSTFGVIDRDGDVVKASAIEDGLELPMVWSHDWHQPVGRGHVDVGRKSAKFVGRFFTETDAGLQAYKTVKAMGDLQQWSWGFEIKEWSFGEHDGREGVRFITDTEPFEVSPVLVGANRETATTSIKGADLPPDYGWYELTGHAGQKARIAIPDDGDVWISDILDDIWEFKAAIAPHRTATSDAAWSGPSSEAAIADEATAAQLRRMYAWVEPDGDPATKAAYRFIHHFSQGGAASTRASSLGIAILNGARGGTTIPSGDRRGVWRHLAGHLRAADMEPPELRGYTPEMVVAASPFERWLNEEFSDDELKAAGLGRHEVSGWQADADLKIATAKYGLKASE